MQLDNIRSDMKYFIILLTIGSFLLAPLINVNAASSSRWYAGYYYYGYSGSAPEGVMADIYCVSPYIPNQHTFFQWISIVASYSPLLWVQVGYLKHCYWFFFIPIVIWSFYAERQDITGYARYLYGFPLSTHTYGFRIYHYMGPSYAWYIFEGYTQLFSGNLHMNYQDEIDLQVMSEVTTSSIDIWTSHFSKIRYLDGGNWYYWNRHRPDVDPPYVLQEVSHYEFYAWRG